MRRGISDPSSEPTPHFNLSRSFASRRTLPLRSRIRPETATRRILAPLLLDRSCSSNRVGYREGDLKMIRTLLIIAAIAMLILGVGAWSSSSVIATQNQATTQTPRGHGIPPCPDT